MTGKVIERLTLLGFTRYEAQAYVALLRRNPLTGYELAKASGVPRPNIYAVLDRLEERGAVMRVDEESATQFVPIASEELVGRLRRDFERTLDEARVTLGEIGEKIHWEPVMNTRGYAAALALARNLVRASKRELLLAVWPQEAEALADDTAAALAKGVKITTLCLAGCKHGCGFCRGDVHRYRVDPDGRSRWLVLASDSSEALTAEVKNQEAMAVRTRQRLVVELAAWYIRHTIAVAALVKDLGEGHRDVLSPDTRAILRSIGSRDAGIDWLQQVRTMLDTSADTTAE